MFSERTAWRRDQNPFTRAVDAAKALRGSELIDLTVSNPTSIGLEYERDRILAAVAGDRSLIYRPAPFGLPEAREAVAAYYARRGIRVQPDDVAIVATTSEAYAFLMHLLANVGESVAVPSPSYPLFAYLADLSDVMLTPYHLRYGPNDGWRLDASSLEEALDETSRAIITVCPNNPTGSTPTAGEREHLVSLARERDLALISDEVFLDYLVDRERISKVSFAAETSALTFTLSGVSKVAGLPQMKLSWMVLSGPRALVDEAKARLEIIADTFLSVAAPIQHALPELLAAAEPWQDRLRARLAENRRLVEELCRGGAAIARSSHGGWYAILDLPTARDDEAWAVELLEKDGVVVHPGYLFDVEESSAVVLSLIGPSDQFGEGLRRIVARCATLH